MLETVDVGPQCIACYGLSAGEQAISQIRALAEPLRGARVPHLNATPYGGGVAEILRSEAPLLRDLGLASDWKIITGDEKFFSVTKAIHNGLQGAARRLTPQEQETYLAYSTRNARLLVCGMQIDPDRSISSEYLGRLYYFCAPACQQPFTADPGRFLRSEARKDSGR
jgi:trehalose synthase